MFNPHIFLPSFLHINFSGFYGVYIASVKNENGDPCLPYVALTMDKDLNITVYNNRGRPTKEETLKMDVEMKAEQIKLQ